MFQPNQLTPEQPWFSHVLVFLKWLSPTRFWRWFLSLSRLLRTFSCTFSQWPVGDFLCGYLLWVCILHELWYNRAHFKTALTAVNSKKPNRQNFVTVRALTVSTENKYCFHARYCTSVICQFHPGGGGGGWALLAPSSLIPDPISHPKMSLSKPVYRYRRGHLKRDIFRNATKPYLLMWHMLIWHIFNNYSSSPNGLWIDSPRGRRPYGLLTQRP